MISRVLAIVLLLTFLGGVQVKSSNAFIEDKNLATEENSKVAVLEAIKEPQFSTYNILLGGELVASYSIKSRFTAFNTFYSPLNPTARFNFYDNDKNGTFEVVCLSNDGYTVQWYRLSTMGIEPVTLEQLKTSSSPSTNPKPQPDQSNLRVKAERPNQK